jgi:hypothetical protein
MSKPTTAPVNPATQPEGTSTERRVAQLANALEAQRLERLRAEAAAQVAAEDEATRRVAVAQEIAAALPAAVNAVGLEVAEQTLGAAIASYTAACLVYQDALGRAWHTLLAREPLSAGIAAKSPGSVRIGNQTFPPRDLQAGIIATARRVIAERWPQIGLRLATGR